MQVFAFSPDGKLVLKTRMVQYPLALDTLIAAFKNGQWTYFVDMDENIGTVLGKSQ